MRKLLLALLFCVATTALAEEEAKPIDIHFEPLGDTAEGIAVRIEFRFGVPPEVPPETGLFLQGSLMQNGQVLRNFRLPVLQEQNEPLRTVQVFQEGTAEVEARLVMPIDEGAPVIVVKTTESFAVTKTNKPYVAGTADGAEGIVAEGVVPESLGAVKIRSPRRDVAPNLFVVDVDVMPPVKRVEFWVEGKKILARNAPPYSAELDLGKLPKRVEVRAIGYDQYGHYVDADAFIVNERETPLEVKITRTQTPDGLSHFKLSIQNPKNTNLKTIELYAGDKKIYEWKEPPYAVDLPTARLSGVEFVRASVVDSTGYEAGDLLFMSGDRFIEQIEVNLVELPIAVSDSSGNPMPDLTQQDFTVLENGKPQTVESFNFAANLPISVGVLLDHSGSMKARMEDARKAAAEFFADIIKKNDRAFIAPFASDPARNAPFVSDLTTLKAQVDAIPDAEGSTALYDAIITGLYRFRGLQGRKALIVITDGEDTSSHVEYDEMLAYARASHVPLYFIGIGFVLGEIGGPGRMKALAAETGGVAYFIRNTKQLGDTYKQLEKELRSQYLLSYRTESTKNDQAYRTIEVKVNRPNARVRTIRGFIP